MPKRIIVCYDGTWQSSDSGAANLPSNVARFSRMLAATGVTADDQPIEQVVYYQTGVGTGAEGLIDRVIQGNSLQFAMLRLYLHTETGATGDGLEEHVIQAYHFIATNYYPGDEICLFGFSRGAYTARAVGWVLTKMGMLMPVDLEHFRDLYAWFKKHGDSIDFNDDCGSPEL